MWRILIIVLVAVAGCKSLRKEKAADFCGIFSVSAQSWVKGPERVLVVDELAGNEAPSRSFYETSAVRIFARQVKSENRLTIDWLKLKGGEAKEPISTVGVAPGSFIEIAIVSGELNLVCNHPKFDSGSDSPEFWRQSPL